MTKRKISEDSDLRRRAEAMAMVPTEHAAQADSLSLLHELKVHQIELELQNDELRTAQLEADVALSRYTHLYNFAPVAYFTLDPIGAICRLNVAAAQMLGGDPSQFLHRHFADFVVEGARQAFSLFLNEALSSDIQQSIDLPLATLDSPQQARIVHLGTAPAEASDYLNVAAFDITERTNLEQQTRDYRAVLEANDRQKDAFIATLSHEIRNPLAAINNATAVLNRLESGDAQVRWVANTIGGQLEQLNRLVDDLLDVSRITQGQFGLKLSRLTVQALLHRALAISQPLIESFGHRLEVSEPMEPLFLQGDMARLVQVIDNVLHNAAKYTPRGGQIRLDTARDGDDVVIRVRDNGIGIVPDSLPHVFTPFFQDRRKSQTLPSGMGIGLSLVERLVQLHGGTVAVRSNGTSPGTEVTIRLPLANPETEPERMPNAKQPEADMPRLQILVVEDDPAVADTFVMLLRTMGHRVELAGRGDEAFSLAKAIQPDVIFLDIGMPDLNGYDILCGLRNIPQLKNVPVVAVTGYGQETDLQRTAEAGFYRHLVKPVDLVEIESLLKEIGRRL